MKLPTLNAYLLAGVLFFAAAAATAFGPHPGFAIVWLALGCTMLAFIGQK